MTTNELKFWLKGFLEGKVTLTAEEIDSIRKAAHESRPEVIHDYPAYFATPDYTMPQFTYCGGNGHVN